jgi:DNA gyrase/topoisomerase IV subunit A
MYRGSDATSDVNRPDRSRPLPGHPNWPTGGNRRSSQGIRSAVKAKNTIRAYRADWDHFESWCRSHGQSSLPASPETVALYVTDLSSTHKTATITRRISAISQAHQIAGLETPTKSSQVRLVLAGIRRSLGTAQIAKTPVLVDDLRRMLAGCRKICWAFVIECFCS